MRDAEAVSDPGSRLGDMDIKNNGVEFDVYSVDGSKHLGDLIVTKTGLTWCKGATRRENGAKANWDRFIEWMEARDR